MIAKIKQNKFIFYFLFTLTFCFPCFSENVSPQIQLAFEEANIFYKEGKYDNAITSYERIIRDGSESGAIYYNIGNCFVKKQAWGKAILNYEKAAKFIPRDQELKTNLNIARSKISGYAITAKKSWRTYTIDLFFKNFTAYELFMLIICLYLSLIGIAIANLFIMRNKRVLAYTASAIFVLFVIGNISLYDRIKTIEAVVITPDALTRFEPFESSTVFFELPQGTKVKVLESKDDWVKIQRSDNKSGWIYGKSLETV